jgi:putative endopeptidase
VRKDRFVVWFLLAAALFSFTMVSSGCGGESVGIRLEDDYYAYENADWLAKTEIPADKGSISVFDEVQDGISKTLTDDLDKFFAGESAGDPIIGMAAGYYGMFLDSGKRNEVGFSPASADFARIDKIKSVKDVSSQMILDGMPSPFNFYVKPGLTDTSTYALYATMPGTFLGDPSYYEDGSEIGAKLKPCGIRYDSSKKGDQH